MNGAQDYQCYGPYGPLFSSKRAGAGSPWHPGTRGHQLRGDSIAFLLLSVLQEAVDAVYTLQLEQLEEQASALYNSSSHAVANKGGEKERGESGWNDGIWSDGYRRRELPQYNQQLSRSQSHFRQLLAGVNLGIYKLTRAFLSRHIGDIPSSGSSSGSVLAQHKPVFCDSDICGERVPQCFTDYEPRVQHGIRDLVLDSQWERSLSFLDAAAVSRSEARGMGYIDRKYIYVSTGPNSTLSLYISIPHSLHDRNASVTGQQSRLFVCEVQKGFVKYPATMADLPTAEVSVYQNTITNSLRKEIANNNTDNVKLLLTDVDFQRKKRVLTLSPFKDYCYKSNEYLPEGDHVVQLTQITDKLVNLAYILYK